MIRVVVVVVVVVVIMIVVVVVVMVKYSLPFAHVGFLPVFLSTSLSFSRHCKLMLIYRFSAFNKDNPVLTPLSASSGRGANCR